MFPNVPIKTWSPERGSAGNRRHLLESQAQWQNLNFNVKNVTEMLEKWNETKAKS
jgi:hypothetical protein